MDKNKFIDLTINWSQDYYLIYSTVKPENLLGSI